MASDNLHVWSLSKGRSRNRLVQCTPMTVDTFDMSRLAKMAPRSVRRAAKHMKFRPVYHHGIAVTPLHGQVIAALRAKDRKRAQYYQTWLSVPRALVTWGVELQGWTALQGLRRMRARHEVLKAEGKWIERNLKFGYEDV